MFLLFAFVQPAGQQLMIAQHAQPVILFSNQGYPMSAWQNGWQGDVVANLTIGRDGKVSACEIVQSSGHQILDHSTCYVILKYSQFTPARDEQGNPVEDHFRTPPIKWRLRR